MATLYLVRHAHAPWQHDQQHRLSAKGRADAARVADLLDPCGITAIYSSPYPRAVETVEPLAERLGLGIQIEPDLRERRLSEAPVEDFRAAAAWLWAHPDDALPGGERNRDALARARAVLGRLAGLHDGEPIALATHGSILALIFGALDPSFTIEDWDRMTTPDVFRLRDGQLPERLWTP